MATSVDFDTATFNEAIQRAARVAATKGSAFDKASGILLEIWPGEPFPVVIKATNLDVYWTNWIDAKVIGEPTKWRVPSMTLAAVAATLPTANGARVTLQTEGRHLVLKSKPKLKARLNLMPADLYPLWSAFDPDGLTDVHNLAAALARVEWAAAETSDVILNGVRFNGKDIVATDRFRIATLEMKVPVEEPFVIKSRILSPILPPSTSVKLGFDDHHMLVMPNDETQIRVVMMDGGYPNVDPIMIRDKPDKVRVSKLNMVELIQRALSVRGADRTPLLRLLLGKGELAVFLKNSDYGSMGDVLPVPGYCDHERVELTFAPDVVLAALNNAPGDDIEIGYDQEEPTRPIYLKGSNTYETWIAVRGKPSEE